MIESSQEIVLYHKYTTASLPKYDMFWLNVVKS